MTSFLSIEDIRRRWSCGRTFVYGALADMERGGYLRRLRLGRCQRAALESVERWEADHAGPQPAAGQVRALRALPTRGATPAPPGPPRAAAERLALYRAARAGRSGHAPRAAA